jgi:2-polyprenyl-3-methyl-5-hydroxy-6-metoxy-1,4-benzoquinol methylase
LDLPISFPLHCYADKLSKKLGSPQRILSNFLAAGQYAAICLGFIVTKSYNLKIGKTNMNDNSQFSVDEQQAFYDNRWSEGAERPNKLESWRLIEILKAMADTELNFATQKISICDLGCGRGWIAQQLSGFGDVTAVDLSAEGVRRAQIKWPHIKFEQGDITKYRNDDRFDIVVSTEVLEHIEEKKAFFNTARSLLKPGGHLIITTPNSKLFSFYKNTDAEMQPLELWPSFSEIRNLASTDFSILRYETFIFDTFYTGVFRVISAPKLISLCRTLHIESARRWAHRLFNLGLHQIFHLRYEVLPENRTGC